MEITSGHFYSPNGDSLYIPETILHPGWGEKMSVHVVGDDTKSLPDRVEITFFSYLEDKFYRGRFALPNQHIAELFAAGFPSYKDVSGHSTFNAIVAGVAPGGAVAVWVSGMDRQLEVFFGYAEEVDLDWHQTLGMPGHVDRRKLVSDVLAHAAKDDPLVKPAMEHVPFGIWATYRVRYPWKPVFEGMPMPDYLERVHSFNGERDCMQLPLDQVAQRALRPIPNHILFAVEATNTIYELTFDEQETLFAFQHLSANGQPLELVFSEVMQDGEPVFGVFLRNRDETLRMSKLKREFFAID